MGLAKTPYRKGAGGDLSGGKRKGRDADHSTPSSTEVKNGGVIPPFPYMPHWHSA
jgi:hypothetical protein